MKTVICDCRISPKIERALRIRGFEPLMLPRCDEVSEAISSHPDTLIFRLGSTLVTSADYCERASYIFSDLRERHTDINIIVASDPLGGTFPADCTYNALAVGKYLLCRKGSISQAVTELAKRCGLEPLFIKQGYPACSAISLGDGIISADEGMLRTAKAAGLRTYKIECGHISLPPHEYGFIGGASGIYGDKLFFLGDYKRHPSADIIEAAAAEHGLEPVSLSDEPLCDLGGLIFI
jgi:hypothetical protein